MSIILSFCIPTRNRAPIIRECLNSIIMQATPEVEIIVVDGASTDNTEEIVGNYKKHFPRIYYYRRDECMGVDADILKTVELAQGEYCWLMSDDDRLEPESIEYVLAQLKKNCTISGTSVNRISYDKNMLYRVHTVPSTAGGCLSTDYLFNDYEKCFSVLGVHFGFLSCQIVKRSIWNDVILNEDLRPYYNCWLTVYIYGQMLRRNPKWLYIDKRCVGHRTGNDSFLASIGAYNRQVLAHVEFEKIIFALFGKKSLVHRKISHTMVSDMMARSLSNIKSNGVSILVQLKLFIMYTKQYWSFPLYWFKIVPIFFIPNLFLRVVRVLYFRMMSKSNRIIHKLSGVK